MRGFDCACGAHLEAADDEALISAGRAHLDEVHPEMVLSDDELRAAMAGGIYDVQG